MGSLGKSGSYLRGQLNRAAAIQMLPGLLVSAIAWVFDQFTVWTGLLALFLVIGAGVTRGYGKRMVRQLEQAAAADHQQSLTMLAHYRHDVMNQVQLLKGYLQLKKYDRLAVPIQALIDDSQRHSVLANFPGQSLPYFLLQRALTVPEIRLQVEMNEAFAEFESVCEDQLIHLLDKVIRIGQQVGQTLGITADWHFQIDQAAHGLAIILHVSGEHVNDTYISQLKQQSAVDGWVVEAMPQADPQQLILYNGKLGELKCL